jgi:predicted small lipoprotein YifL
MRVLVIGIALVALAGCGGEKAPVAKAPPAKKAKAPEVVFLYRVQGDDPLPDSVSLRADGSADVRRGGGRAGFRTVQVALSDAVAQRATRLAERAPWKALAGRTVKPGGFGGWDNDMRYMLRRGRRSITVTDARMPRAIRPLITQLDAIIEGDTGRQLSNELHSAVEGTIAP